MHTINPLEGNGEEGTVVGMISLKYFSFFKYYSVPNSVFCLCKELQTLVKTED